MLESFNPKNGIGYQKLTEEEMSKRGILGRLVGIIADYKNPTRNGRHYSEDLWDKVFENPIMQEKIKNRCLFGELGHPENRLETDIEKVAICLAEVPKKGTDGKIYGVFDILNTPNGKILKALCDYGCNIGVSSRGEGDVIDTFDGNESVDPSTYDCQGWDAVLLPAVQAARPNYVTESFNNKNLKVALQEALNSSTPEQQKIMKESLDNLNIDYQVEKPVDIDTTSNSMEAGDTGSLVEELQNSVKENSLLKKTIIDLNQKLSVCYAKETSSQKELDHYKQCVISLSEQTRSAKALKNKVAQLEEDIKSKDEQIYRLEESKKLLEDAKKRSVNKYVRLNEDLTSKDSEVKSLKNDISRLNEELNISKSEKSSSEKKLIEEIESLKKDSQIKESDYSYKLKKQIQLTEKYKKIAKVAIDRYILSEAAKLGVQPQEIKNRLNENYSFDDIDKVCEDLQKRIVNINKLPFLTESNTIQQGSKKMQVRESVEPIKPTGMFDDSIDEGLIQLANLQK